MGTIEANTIKYNIMEKEKKVRVTQKWLLKKCNEIFDRLEIEYRIIDIYKTRLLGRDYEGGAACFILTLGNKDYQPLVHHCYLYIFLPISEIQKNIDEGKELRLELYCRNTLSEAYFTF